MGYFEWKGKHTNCEAIWFIVVTNLTVMEWYHQLWMKPASAWSHAVQHLVILQIRFTTITGFAFSFQITQHLCLLAILPCGCSDAYWLNTKHDKVCSSGFSKGQKKSICVQWVIDHNSHVKWMDSLLLKQAEYRIS